MLLREDTARSAAVGGRRVRYVLAAIRLANGAAATFAPAAFSKRLGVDVSAEPAVLYPLRLFGIRTLLLGLDLLRRGDGLEQAIRVSPAIHAADASAAVLAGVQGHLPRKTAATGAAISLVNLALALRMVAGLRRAREAPG